MKIKKPIFISLFTVFFLMFSFLDADINQPTPQRKQVLRVAVDPSLPPFQFERKGKIVGLNIDILNLIAMNNDLKLDYITVNKEVSTGKLLEGEVDLVLGIRYDADLNDKISFSEGIVQSVICMLAKSENHKDIQENLNNSPYLASVENNSVELNFLHNLRRINYNVAFNQLDVFELLLMDRADFLLGVKDTVEYLLREYNLSTDYKIVDSYMSPIEYFIAARPEDQNIIITINHGLSRLKLSGEYENLYYTWLDDRQANAAKHLRKVIRISAIGAVMVFIVFLMGFLWNINLKSQVNLKTRELSKINLDLEAQIIETRNNIELKNLICESSPRSIAIFDLEGIISIFNNSALRMASLTVPPIGKSIYDIEPINLMLEGTLENVIENKTSYVCEEFKYRKGDKDYIYRYVMYPLDDFKDELRGVIITIEDITEERKLRDKITERDKNKALTQIIAGLSHEIRNPLTTINAFIELMPAKIDNEKFRSDIITVVPEEIERVDNLIESLIDYAKPRSQNKTNFDILELLDSCLILFNPVLEHNHINIYVEAVNELYVYCDRSQIKQAIINFLLNSIDAIIEKKELLNDLNYKGEIIISCYRNEKEVTLKITDNGIGMDEIELGKSYDMFYTTKEKGTGLGTPLSIQMLNINNCKVSVESKKYEHTTITLQFPL